MEPQTIIGRYGFAATHDVPIAYLPRIREYYMALGYGEPYEWAHYEAVPFHPPNRPLSECRIALITTAAPYQPGKGDQGPGAPYNAKAKFYSVYSGDTAKDHDLRISHLAIDRTHTIAEDPAGYFPLTALRQSAASGRIGSVAPRFHGVPTNRSHRVTLEIDSPEIVARCKSDGVDAAILVPNCPVCHQTVSLAARLLEEDGTECRGISPAEIGPTSSQEGVRQVASGRLPHGIILFEAVRACLSCGLLCARRPMFGVELYI